jgi:site-specific recombinase XerD
MREDSCLVDSDHPHAVKAWLTMQANLGLAPNTLDAYRRDLEDYFAFCASHAITPPAATRADIARYVHDLSHRPRHQQSQSMMLTPASGLANATIVRRLTTVRLYYDYLFESGVRDENPVGRGQYTPGKAFGGHRERALVRRYQKLPWIPNETQWNAIVEAVRQEPIRNRVMFAFAYDAALRREELCALTTDDVNPGQQTLTIRAETTKNRRSRVVAYSVITAQVYRAYLAHRRMVSPARGPLFVSESRRNYGQPISIWTWSKVVEGIAERAHVPAFTTHTLRHLSLTDLARAGWDLHELAVFAGHRSVQTTLHYIHLSGRDLAAKMQATLESVHAWRATILGQDLL